MAKVEFYLTEEDVDRLFAIKANRGKDSLSGNEFAKELLVAELHRLHPDKVEEEN